MFIAFQLLVVKNAYVFLLNTLLLAVNFNRFYRVIQRQGWSILQAYIFNRPCLTANTELLGSSFHHSFTRLLPLLRNKFFVLYFFQLWLSFPRVIMIPIIPIFVCFAFKLLIDLISSFLNFFKIHLFLFLEWW